MEEFDQFAALQWTQSLDRAMPRLARLGSEVRKQVTGAFVDVDAAGRSGHRQRSVERRRPVVEPGQDVGVKVDQSGPSLPRGYDSVAMRTMNAIHDSTCSVVACAEILGAKWTAVLVHDLSEGARRFTELEHSCPGISPRTLSERLRALEQEGILVRRSYAESPPRVEYELTAKGEGLLPIIEEMRRFGHAWLVEDEPASV
jgi:DNA-binding HxlR family transcriptional regulator